jgi:hypothetical protein
VLLARQLTGLETHIPEVTEMPEFQLSAASLASVVDYLDELNISGPLTRRCQRLAQRMAYS